jgi:hypothetical protein
VDWCYFIIENISNISKSSTSNSGKLRPDYDDHSNSLATLQMWYHRTGHRSSIVFCFQGACSTVNLRNIVKRQVLNLWLCSWKKQRYQDHKYDNNVNMVTSSILFTILPSIPRIVNTTFLVNTCWTNKWINYTLTR